MAYGFCIYLAWHKGYPRLTVYIALIILTASINLSDTSAEQRAVMAFILSIFLLLHAIALPTRRR